MAQLHLMVPEMLAQQKKNQYQRTATGADI